MSSSRSSQDSKKTIKAGDLVNVLNHVPGDTEVDDIAIDGVAASKILNSLRGSVAEDSISDGTGQT